MNKKNILIYSPLALWSPHFETDLDIIQRHLDEGDCVTLLQCDAALSSCAGNPYHSRGKCLMCQSRLSSGIKWINDTSLNVARLYDLTREQKKYINKTISNKFEDLESLITFKPFGVDLGLSVLSSVVSILREPEPDLVKNRKLVINNIKTALIVYFSIKNKLEKLHPDIFYIFNGRFSWVRPALRIAQKENINVIIHERSGILGNYGLTKGTYPHDIDVIKEEIEEVNRNLRVNDKIKSSIVNEWYHERIDGKEQGFQSFTGNQTRHNLPDNFDSNKINVVIFNSSEDEFVAMDEWSNRLYSDQNEGISLIAMSLENNNAVSLYLRVHPNLKNANNTQTLGLREIKFNHANLNIIEPDSAVDTYKLINAADIIISFGSTVGVEALFLGKMMLLVGRASYEDLGGFVKPNTHDELVQTINNYTKDKTPIPYNDMRSAAEKFALWQNYRGRRFQYVKQTGVFNAVMVRDGKETQIKPSWLSYKYSEIEKKLLNLENA